MVKLVYFDRTDFQQLIDWIHDEELMYNWAGSLFRFPLNERSLDWYIENSNDPETSDVLIYKAIDTKTEKVVGHISLGSINRDDRSARLTRVLVGNTAERGRGFCISMIKALLAIGFEQLHLHRIGLGVYDFNVSAIRCYEKAGFKRDGLLRDVKRHNGSYWSLIEMSILEEEWHSHKKK